MPPYDLHHGGEARHAGPLAGHPSVLEAPAPAPYGDGQPQQEAHLGGQRVKREVNNLYGTPWLEGLQYAPLHLSPEGVRGAGSGGTEANLEAL